MDLMAEITFTPNASKRTKDRIREHGPVFKMVEFDNPACMDGVPSVFLRSEDGWFGWLRSDEILCRAPEMEIQGVDNHVFYGTIQRQTTLEKNYEF